MGIDTVIALGQRKGSECVYTSERENPPSKPHAQLGEKKILGRILLAKSNTDPDSRPASTPPTYVPQSVAKPNADSPDTENAGVNRAAPRSALSAGGPPTLPDPALSLPEASPARAPSVVVDAPNLLSKNLANLPAHQAPIAPRQPSPNKTLTCDQSIRQAIQKQKNTKLAQLLNAHPHAGRDPADKSPGAFISRFFRTIASWFNSDAFMWQTGEAVDLLNEAARVGNTGAVEILLARCMDLHKDVPMLERALGLACAHGHAEAVEVLLKEILAINPAYSTDPTLAAKAAHKGRGNVLEILVKNGMALPLERASWSRYGKAIEDFLWWSAARKSNAVAQERLLSVAQSDRKEKMARLKPQFGWHLNRLRCCLNPAQKACLMAEMYAGVNLPLVDAQTFQDAGFTEQTASAVASELNANAVRQREAGQAAPRSLSKAVAVEFARFTETGKSNTDLRAYLMKNGMYGVLAEAVEAAYMSAASDSSWTAPGADRGMLLAVALEKSAGEAMTRVYEDNHASGDLALFAKVLSPQLDLLIAYHDAQRARVAQRISD